MQTHTIRHSLGIPQLSREQMVLEITERLRCARLWCQRYWKLLCNPDLRCRAKFQLYKFFVRPILTYGCELWDLDELNARKLQRFECGLLVEIYKSKYPQRHPHRLKPNVRAIYNRYRTSDVVEHVNSERLRWATLLRDEEIALRRPRRRPQHLVHWWDKPLPPTNLRTIQTLNPNIKNGKPNVSRKKVKGSSRTKSMDDAPG